LIVNDADLEKLKGKVKEFEGKLNSQAELGEDECKLNEMEARVCAMESDRQKKREAVKRLHAKFEKIVLIEQRAKDLCDLQQNIDEKAAVEKAKIVAALKVMPPLPDLGQRVVDHVDRCVRSEQEYAKEFQAVQGRLIPAGLNRDRILAELAEVDNSLKSEKRLMSTYESTEIVKDVVAKKMTWQSAIENLDKELNAEIKLNLASESMGELFDSYCKAAESKKGCPLCERAFQKVASRMKFKTFCQSIIRICSAGFR
jgi:hypothetical protein